MNKIEKLIEMSLAHGVEVLNNNMFEEPPYMWMTTKGVPPSEKEKLKPKKEHTFNIHGVTIMATSRKDAIKRLKKKKVMDTLNTQSVFFSVLYSRRS